MDFKKKHILLNLNGMIYNRLLRTAGPFLLRKWKKIYKDCILTIEDYMLPEVLRIQVEVFNRENREKLVNYSKSFRDVFYVINNNDKVIGYCIYYLKPALSFKGFEMQSVLSALAIDINFRGKGFAERLLKESIEEMKLNGITVITLYVQINNHHAIQLYKKIGFRIITETKNICGYGEICYKMELKLV
jgi:[ribosomal protein S18]-alanine N-acetyltransferase